MTDQTAADDAREILNAIGNIRFGLWACPIAGHSDRCTDGRPAVTVEWTGDTARCTAPGCTQTSRTVTAHPDVSADHLADWLGRHEWYTHPDHPALHRLSAHQAHHYDHRCAICRGDLRRVAAAVLAYLGQPADARADAPTVDLAPVLAHQWSVRYPDGFVDGARFTEAGARQRAAELGSEFVDVVYRVVGPWQPAGTPDGAA